MIWQDLTNAIFEGGMAFAIMPSVLKLYRDKLVRGIHWFHILPSVTRDSHLPIG